MPNRGVFPSSWRIPDAYRQTHMSPELFLTAMAVATMIPATAAALADWRTQRVPDSMVIAALAPALLTVAMDATPMDRVLAAVVGAGAMALPLLLVHLVSPAAIGFGDVKLSAVLGCAVGVVAPRLALPALAAAAGLTLLVACCRRRAAVPFTPGLVVGAAAAL